MSCFFFYCNKQLIDEVIENILDITGKTTINSQHVKDFERLRAFEDVTVSDHSEIISKASPIWVNDIGR